MGGDGRSGGRARVERGRNGSPSSAASVCARLLMGKVGEGTREVRERGGVCAGRERRLTTEWGHDRPVAKRLAAMDAISVKRTYK